MGYLRACVKEKEENPCCAWRCPLDAHSPLNQLSCVSMLYCHYGDSYFTRFNPARSVGYLPTAAAEHKPKCTSYESIGGAFLKLLRRM